MPRWQVPISPYQAPFWELHDRGLSNPAHHLAVAASLRGPLDHAALSEALYAVAARHEALRVALAPPGSPPAQFVREPEPVPLKEIDLTALSADEQPRRLSEVFVEEHLPLFDLCSGQPFRATLIRLAPRHHALVLTAHHVAIDARSTQVVYGELLALYEDRVAGRASDLPPPRFDLAGIVRVQEAMLGPESFARLARYWRGRLEGWRPGLDLPTDRPRGSRKDHRTAASPIVLDAPLRKAVEALARQERAGVASVLLGAWLALLAERADQEEVTVLSPLANRWKRDHESLVGLFTNSVVVRGAVPRGSSFRDLLASLRQTALTDLAHGTLPLAWLEHAVPAARALRRVRPRHADWVRFNLLPPLPERWAPQGSLEVASLAADFGAAGEDLHLQLQGVGTQFEGALHYDTQCFERATAERLAEDYKSLLERVCAAPGEPPRRPTRPTAAATASPVALAATFTAEPLEPALAWWMEQLDLPTEARFAPFNQVHQQLLDPGGAFARVRGGAGVVLVRAEDYLRDTPGGTPDTARLAAAIHDLGDALAEAAARATPVLVLSCPASPESLADPTLASALAAAEDGLALVVGALPGVSMVRAEELLSRADPNPWYDEHADRLGRAPYTPAFYTLLGSVIARWLTALRRSPLKVVVVDCDETLWRGVVGEVGPRAVVVDPARRRLQERLLELQRRGVLLCLASKNAEADVLAVLDTHPDMAIRREHLVAWRVDWAPKSHNLESLSRELSLGLEGFAFLDDNPVECAEMRAYLPEVLTLELPRAPDALERFLDNAWGLDPSPRAATAEDRERTAMYRQNAAREQVRRGASSFLEFLASLDLEVVLAPMCEDDIERAAQLTQRTNQLNLTTRRYRPDELRAFGGHAWTVRVRDRFGDYGLVGVVLFAAVQHKLVVDTLLLSCRVLGRGVEHRLIAALGRHALEAGLSQVVLPFIRTARNQPAEDFLRRLPASRREEGGISWTVLSAEAARDVQPTADASPEEPASAPTPRPSAPRAAPSAVLQRAAGDLADPARLAALLAERRRAGTSGVHAIPPRTPIEIQLAPMWAEVLGLEQAGRDEDFFDGGDSLHAVLLLANIKRVFGVSLDLGALQDHPTLAGLAAHLDAVASGMAPAAVLDLRAEARLPDDLVLGPPWTGAPHGRVLLTGASGAVGAHLLLALLEREDRRVVCLVRARDADEGRERLSRAFLDQRLPTEPLARADVLVGDLEQPRLGLSPEAFTALGASIDAIFHNGARLGELLPYAAVRAANVEGTLWVLRLAALARTPVHHVSTLAILAPSLEGGYSQSKWVAERLVLAAGALGLPVAIYRLGLVTGHSQSGATTLSGSFARVLAALARLRAAPPAPDAALPIAPVDFCARAIAWLAATRAASGENYHLCAPEPLPVGRLFELVRAAGYKLEPMSLEDWRAWVGARREGHALADMLDTSGHERSAPRFECARTQAALRGAPFAFPAIDAALLGRYLAFLRERGAVPEPA